MMLRYLIEKEFKQFMRNKLLPRMVVMFPVMVLLVFPWVTTFEIKNVEVVVVDNDNSTLSRRLTEKIQGSKYFHYKGTLHDYNEAYNSLENSNIDVILDVPANFEKNLLLGMPGTLQISANAVNSVKGNLGSGYLNRVIIGLITDQLRERGITAPSLVKLEVKNRYNPHMDYKFFMIPALITMLIIVICGFLPSLNLVGEKETGTIEQINVTPVNKWLFILAKLIPYWVIGLIVVSVGFVISWLVYGYLPLGSFSTIYLAVCLFSLVMSGLGFLVANYSETMQQSMFVMFFFVVCFMLISGLFTPIHSMPNWAQNIAALSPPKYFIEIMRSVYLKGSNIVELSSSFIWLSGLTFGVNMLAVLSYKKRN